MKFLVTTLVLLVVVSPALAGNPLRPGQHYSAFASKMVCPGSDSFKTPAVPIHKGIHIKVSIAGKSAIQVSSGANVLDSMGYGIVVRLSQNIHHRAPLAVRTASVRDNCLRVNILASWD